ncbi:MAG: Calx-beta domain-containing protein [Actinomycetota bacterium]
MKARARVAVVAAVAGLLVPAPARACATGHLGLRWAAFQPPGDDFGPVYLYWVEEPASGDSTVELTIRADPEGSCTSPAQPATATYAVEPPPVGTPRSAAPSQDYEAILAGSTGPLYDHRQPPNEHVFDVTVHSDAPLPEPVVEQARAHITLTDAKPQIPQDVPLWIVDSDGLSRASLESAGPYQQQELFRDIEIPVFRAGDAGAPLSVDYSFAGSSASPAMPGEDFTVLSPQPLVFGPGERLQFIDLAVRADGMAEPTEEATVVITSPSTVDPTDPLSATIEIVDSPGGYALPSSRFHHPRQRLRYPPDDYRLREIHVFTEKGGGGVVSEAEIAIRMNRKGGVCSWLTGNKFRKGDCGEPRWIPSDGQYEADFFYFRLRQLSPSKGSIRSYTAYSRAIDVAQNAETEMARGRNANTFEVKTATK